MGICAVWGTPQSGKTTLAVNLAYAASRGEMSVCLVSPQAYGEISAYLGVNIPDERSLQAALKGSASIRQSIFKVDELFYVLAAPAAADAFDWSYTSEQAQELLDLVREAFDIVLVDCLSQADDLLSAWALHKSDTVLLNTGGRTSCVMWNSAHKKALQALRPKAVQVSSEVVADFDYDAMYQLLGYMPDIHIPYVGEATLFQNESAYLYELPGKRGWSYAKAINRIYEVIS